MEITALKEKKNQKISSVQLLSHVWLFATHVL